MISKTSPLPQRLLAYTKERFPLIPVMILVVLMAGASAHLFSRWMGLPFTFTNWKFWGATVTVFLFMLQLRMSDEIKDFEKDRVAYPERLLSQGIVSLDHIRIVFFVVVGIQLLINVGLGVEFLALLAVLQIYAFLMAKEFFAKDFLEHKIGLYLVSHQIILLPLMIYSALPFVSMKFFFISPIVLYPLLYLALPYTVYELSRKTWSPDRENENADSYTRFWGINKTLMVEMSLVVGIAFIMDRISIILPFVHKVAAGVLFLGYFAVLMLFKKKPTRKNSKLVELAGSILLLGLYALSAFVLGV